MSILRSQIIVLVFLVAGLLGGCGKETQVETVELWHAYRGAEKEAIDRLAADFNANQGDYQLEVLAVASKAYKSKLTSAIPRGNGPDLFIEAHELVGEWARSSLIQPVSPEVELERFTERSVDALRFEGETWAVPLALKSLALFRNRSLVPDAPATFEDALRAGRASGQRPFAWETGEFFYQVPFAHAFGAQVVPSEGGVRLDEDGLGRSMDYVAELVRQGDLPPEADGAKVSTLFNEGRVAFVVSGPWFLGDIRDDLDFAVSPLPDLGVAGTALEPFLTVESLFVAAGAVVVGITVYFVTRPSGDDDDQGSFGGYEPGITVIETQCEVKDQLLKEKGELGPEQTRLQGQFDAIVKNIGDIEAEHGPIKKEISDTEAILDDTLDDLSKAKKNLIGVSTGFGIFGVIIIALIGIKIVNTVRGRKKSE